MAALGAYAPPQSIKHGQQQTLQDGESRYSLASHYKKKRIKPHERMAKLSDFDETSEFKALNVIKDSQVRDEEEMQADRLSYDDESDQVEMSMSERVKEPSNSTNFLTH